MTKKEQPLLTKYKAWLEEHVPPPSLIEGKYVEGLRFPLSEIRESQKRWSKVALYARKPKAYKIKDLSPDEKPSDYVLVGNMDYTFAIFFKEYLVLIGAEHLLELLEKKVKSITQDEARKMAYHELCITKGKKCGKVVCKKRQSKI